MAETNEGSVHSAGQKEEAENEPPITDEATAIKETTDTSSQEIDILSEQFQNYLIIAQALMKTLKRPRDTEICANLLRKVQRLNGSKEAKVKRHNNMFFRYCLRVLKWTSDNQPFELYQYWYRDQDVDEVLTESSTWLEENKSYMSLKRLKDGSTVVYCAVAEDPTAGWQEGGLNILAKIGACSRFPQL